MTKRTFLSNPAWIIGGWILIKLMPSFYYGEYSFLQIGDNADPVLSSIITSSVWDCFVAWDPSMGAGFDRFAYRSGNIEWLLFLVMPGWLANVTYMGLQHIVAAIFIYLILKESFRVKEASAIIGSILFLFLANPDSQQGMSIALIPFMLWGINRIANWKSTIGASFVALLLGILFSLTSHYFLSVFAPLVIIMWFMIIDQKKNWEFWMIVAFWIIGLFLVDLSLLSAIIQAPSSHRVIQESYKVSITDFFTSLMNSFDIYFFVVLGCFFSISSKEHHLRLQRVLSAFLIIITCIALFFLAHQHMMITGIFGKFDFSRISWFLPLFVSIAVALSMEELLNHWSTRVNRWFVWVVCPLTFTIALAKSGFSLDIGHFFSWADFRISVVLLLFLLMWLVFRNRLSTSFRYALIVTVSVTIPIIFFVKLFIIFASNIEGQIRGQLRDHQNYHSFFRHEEIEKFASTVTNKRQFRLAVIENYLVTKPLDNRLLLPSMFSPFGFETADGYSGLHSNRYHELWGRVLKPLLDMPSQKLLADDYNFWGNRFFLFQPRDFTYPNRAQYFTFSEPYKLSKYYNLNLLSLINVRYIVSHIPLQDERLIPIHLDVDWPGKSLQSAWCDGRTWDLLRCAYEKGYPGQKGFYFYENMEVLPRIFLTRQIRSFANAGQVLDAMEQASPQNLASTAFLLESDIPHHDLTALSETKDNFNSTIKFDMQSFDKITIQTKTDQASVLIVTNNYNPFWQATIDNKIKKVFPVDHAFQGIFVEKGQHEVVLEYLPWWKKLIPN